jgi:hypothetical protein
MNRTLRRLAGIGIVLGLSAVVSAKGDTTRITIAGANLASAVEITDLDIARRFQVWSGPGTMVCIGGRANCVDGKEGFISDWPAGAVAQRPTGLAQYQVSFHVIAARADGAPAAERRAYVVLYEYDPATSQGYVYLPGKSDEWYALNVAAIFRGGGREGNWFRASRAWQEVVVTYLPRADR